MAGNETVTNFSLTVTQRLAGPQALTILWPPEDAPICGGGFAISGRLEDTESAVTATIAPVNDPASAAQVRRGWVDREGNFYVEGFAALEAGQSILTVTALDRRGQVAVVQRQIQKSQYSLDFPTPSALDLRLLYYGTTITAQRPDGQSGNLAEVFVNGVTAPLAASAPPNIWAAWTHVTVPLGQCQSVLPFRVVLTAPGGMVAGEWQWVGIRPAFVRVGNYAETESWSQSRSASTATWSYGLTGWDDDTNAFATAAWATASPGQSFSQGTGYFFPRDRWLASGCRSLNQLIHTGGEWVQTRLAGPDGPIKAASLGIPYTNHWTSTANGETTTGDGGSPVHIPDIYGAWRDIALEWSGENWRDTYAHSAHGKLILETGGRPGDLIPFRLDLKLATVEDECYWWTQYCGDQWGNLIYSSWEISAAGIPLASAGTTDAQGGVWVLLRGGAQVDVTPLLEGAGLDRLTRVEALSGQQFAWADYNVSASPALNLTTDSDNDGAATPDDLDDQLEHQIPGCLVPVNDDDADYDGIPGFADGLNWDDRADPGTTETPSSDDTTYGDTFSDLVLTLPQAAQFPQATVTFSYDAAPPSAFIRIGPPALWQPGSSGHLRVWNRFCGNVGMRNKASVLQGGDYLAPGTYPIALLGFTGSATAVSLAIEGIRASEAPGDQSIEVRYDPDGPSGPAPELAASVRVTVTRAPGLDIDSDNTNGREPPDRNYAEDWIEDDPTLPGKILAVNNGDKDGDGIPDFADGFNCSATSSITNQADDGRSARFVPVLLELPWGTDWTAARLRFRYSASDPSTVTYHIPITPPFQHRYYPATGHLRLWTKDGNEPRNANGVAQGGDYIAGDLNSRDPPSYSPAMIGLDSAHRTVLLYVEGVAPVDAGAAEGRIAVEVDPDGDGPAPFQELDAVRVSVTPLQVAVDANRDERISFLPEDEDQTTARRPYVFWLNDDKDRDYEMNDQTAPLDSAEDKLPDQADGSDGYINGVRDLEDFTRLHVRLDPAWLSLLRSGDYTLSFEWRDVQAGSAPAIRLFRAWELDGGTNYLSDEAAATQQVQQAGLAVGLVESASPLTLSTVSYWDHLTTQETSNGLHFLFEATSAGEGQLVAVVSNTLSHHALAESPLLLLSLSPVTNLFEHYTVAGNGDGWYHNENNAYAQIPTNANHVAGTRTHGPEDSEEPDYILFVHGWRMLPWERVTFAATAYKRLWWQGYKGRFGLFSWPTDYTGADWWDMRIQANRQNYDRSERRAWHSAAGLQGLLLSLCGTYPGQVRLCAHSMGNIVASEALRLEGSRSSPRFTVQAYLAFQAASVANAYDNRPPTSGGPELPRAGWKDIPEVYGQFPRAGTNQPYFFGMRQALAASDGIPYSWNYHNATDYALNTWYVWPLNQFSKPDAGWNYDAQGDRWLRINPNPWALLNLTNDTYEIYAHIAMAYSKALGCANNSTNTVAGEIGSALDLQNSPYNLGDDRWEHSAEFNSVIHRRASFWRQVLRDSQIAGF